MTTYTVLQAPPTTDYEAATAKVLGPDAILDAPVLQDKHRVYRGLALETAQRILDECRKVWEARYSYQGDERVKGACFIDEQPCGCVFELTEPGGERRATFQTCQEHAAKALKGWCCEKSVTFPCACLMSQYCPDHGVQHKGSHD